MTMPTEQMQIYADIDQIEPIGDTQSIILSGFDISQILAEFPPREIYEAMTANDEFSSMADYVAEELEHENE